MKNYSATRGTSTARKEGFFNEVMKAQAVGLLSQEEFEECILRIALMMMRVSGDTCHTISDEDGVIILKVDRLE